MESTMVTVKTKTFGVFEIYPLTVERQTQAAQNLAAEGTKITATSAVEHTTLHAAEMARLCLKSWTTAEGLDGLRGKSAAALRKMLMTTEGFAAFVLERANKLETSIAKERFAEVEEEEKNF